MKKISLLLLAILCVGAVFGQKKEVAVMKPYVMDGATVSSTDKLIMVGAMEEAFTKIDGYKAFSRFSQKLIDAEMVFQRSGAVDDEQIKDVGKQTGVTYICTFTLAIEVNELVIKSDIIDVVTAEIMNSKTVVCFNRLNREDIIEKCESLPYKLLNINQGSNTSSGGKPSIATAGFEQTKETLKWQDFSTTINATKQEKITMIYVYDSPCELCTTVEETILADATVVRTLMKDFIPIKFNASIKKDVVVKGQTYPYSDFGNGGVNVYAIVLLDGKMGYPTFVFLDKAGEKIGSHFPVKDTEEFLKILKHYSSGGY